mmetsp:Transcript_46100/g.145033  ORF Transcript_46100/g.145033 Transcript_46100/m.145033 type:complete len:352 (+) Transcript_46100:120-1175(+)
MFALARLALPLSTASPLSAAHRVFGRAAHRPRRRRITVGTATTSPSPGVGPRAHSTRVHRRVQRRAAGRSKSSNLARRGHRRAVRLAHVLPRVGVVGRLLRLSPPELQPRPLDRQPAVQRRRRLLCRLAQRVLDQRAAPLRLHPHRRNLAVRVESVAQVLLRDVSGEAANPERDDALVLGRSERRHALRLIEVLCRQLVALGTMVAVADRLVPRAALRIAQSLADLLHLVRRVAHAAERPLRMQLPHQRREQLGLGGRQLGEAKHAAAGAVRARAVRDAVAGLARPKGAELWQVAVVVGRVRVVAREGSQLLEVGAHRRGAAARVELLVALQRARRERLALVLPVKLLVDV